MRIIYFKLVLLKHIWEENIHWGSYYETKNQLNFYFYFSTEVYENNFAGYIFTSIQPFGEIMKILMSFKTHSTNMH